MTIQMDENIRAVVFQQFCDHGDYMVGIMVKDGKNTATGRIRWYREMTGDPFRDKDEKHWGDLAPKHVGKTVDEILEVVTKTLNELVAVAELSGRRKRPEERYILRRGDDEKLEDFINRFRAMPWVHAKEYTKQ